MIDIPPTRITTTRTGGTCEWTLIPDVERVLFPQGNFEPSSLLKRFDHVALKTGSHRVVYRLITPGAVFYLKHYKIPNWRSRMQNWVRASRARLEWEHTCQLLDLGFDSCQPVALGEDRPGSFVRDSYLITREIPDADQLDEFVEETLPKLNENKERFFRFELARQLGQLTARLHLKGVQHRDYHAGNVLVTFDIASQFLKLWLIDLHQVSFGNRLTIRQSLRNFALLNSYFSNRGNASDRRRFFHAYWETLHEANPTSSKKGFVEYKPSLQMIESHCDREMWKEFLRADQKWERGNRRLIILEGTTSTNSCRGVSELGRATLEQIRTNPEQVLPVAGPVTLNSKTKPLEGFTKIVPEEETSGFSVRTAWDWGHAFIRRRLPTPKPLLFVKTSETSWLVTERIANAVSFPEYVEQVLTSRPFSARRQVNRQLAAQLAWRDRCEFRDRAPSLSNVLIKKETEQVYFLGLGYLEHNNGELEEADILKTLTAWTEEAMQLPGLTRTDRLRFLKRYLQGKPVHWKRYWTRIDSEVHSSLPAQSSH
ncbi:MAG: hypothetical protein KDA65_14165 [Planctomycetaceae bacterium]|nr:hypothetical protein [Planctomycetaceae bacterium]